MYSPHFIACHHHWICFIYLFFYIPLAYSDVYPLFVYVLIESILLFGVCVYNILLLFFS